MQSSQKHPRLEIGLRSNKVNHQNMRRIKERSEVKLVRRFDLWIELDFGNNNNQSSISSKHYPDDNKKSQWKKVAIKNHNEKFQSDSCCKEKEIFDIIFGIINPCNNVNFNCISLSI